VTALRDNLSRFYRPNPIADTTGKMPKQEFEVIDYMGPVVVAIIFAIILFLISFFIINWYCIKHNDDLTIFERMGHRANIRLGPHKMSVIRRGGYASTYAREEEEQSRKEKRVLKQQQAVA